LKKRDTLEREFEIGTSNKVPNPYNVFFWKREVIRYIKVIGNVRGGNHTNISLTSSIT
jgi:hypothetical protein